MKLLKSGVNSLANYTGQSIEQRNNDIIEVRYKKVRVLPEIFLKTRDVYRGNSKIKKYLISIIILYILLEGVGIYTGLTNVAFNRETQKTNVIAKFCQELPLANQIILLNMRIDVFFRYGWKKATVGDEIMLRIYHVDVVFDELYENTRKARKQLERVDHSFKDVSDALLKKMNGGTSHE